MSLREYARVITTYLVIDRPIQSTLCVLGVYTHYIVQQKNVHVFDLVLMQLRSGRQMKIWNLQIKHPGLMSGYEVWQTFLNLWQRGKNSHMQTESSSHLAFHHEEQSSFTQGSKLLFPQKVLVSLDHFTQHSAPTVMRLLQ